MTQAQTQARRWSNDTQREIPPTPFPHTRLPRELFAAICQKDKGLIDRWAMAASVGEITRVTESLKEDPWCALTSRGALLKALARHGEIVPSFLLQTCVKDPDLLPFLAWNESLTSLQLEVIGHHLMAVLGKPSWPLESLTEAVEGLCAQGFLIPPDQLRYLIGAATRGETPSPKPYSARFRIPVEDRRAMRAVHLLARIPQLESPHLADIVGKVGLPKELIRRFLIEHPAAEKRVWISALSCSRGAVAQHSPGLLADYEPAASDPDVRGLLKKNTDSKIILSLLRSPQGDIVPLLRRLKQLSPLETAQLLADGPDEIRAEAPREMIADLLKNSDQEVRATAFRALGPVVPTHRDVAG